MAVPAAAHVGEVASEGASKEVEHAKDGCQVCCLGDGEAKLVAQVRSQDVVDSKLHNRGNVQEASPSQIASKQAAQQQHGTTACSKQQQTTAKASGRE